MDNEILKAIRDIMKEELQPIKQEIKDIKADINIMKEDIVGLRTQVSENTQILKALEHKADVNKSEHDKMSNDITHLQGSLNNIEGELKKVEIVTGKNCFEIEYLKAVK